MSSRLLISHHLFVAAVQETNCAPPAPQSTQPAASVPEPGLRQIPPQRVDFWPAHARRGRLASRIHRVPAGNLTMDPRPLHLIVRACAGELRNGRPEAGIHGVRTHSRLVRPGQIFFALKGERFDGHDFLPEVSKKAAAMVVASARAPARNRPMRLCDRR